MSRFFTFTTLVLLIALFSCKNTGVSLPEKDIEFKYPEQSVVLGPGNHTGIMFNQSINSDIDSLQLPLINTMRYKRNNIFLSFIINGNSNTLYNTLIKKYNGRLIDTIGMPDCSHSLTATIDGTHYVGYKMYEYPTTNKYVVAIVGNSKENVLQLMKYNFISKKQQ